MKEATHRRLFARFIHSCKGSQNKKFKFNLHGFSNEKLIWLLYWMKKKGTTPWCCYGRYWKEILEYDTEYLAAFLGLKDTISLHTREKDEDRPLFEPIKVH